MPKIENINDVLKQIVNKISFDNESDQRAALEVIDAQFPVVEIPAAAN